jgi:hypothetical protein
MKKLFVLTAALFCMHTGTSYAQDAAKHAAKSPLVTASTAVATVSYSQPTKKGRVIFGDLVPYGKVWRTGANMSTDITFNEDVVIDGKTLAKGTYAIFTIPEAKQWTVIFNSHPKQRGASEYDQHKDKNVVETVAKVENLKEVVEAFTINVESNKLVFSWDQVKVEVPFKKK